MSDFYSIFYNILDENMAEQSYIELLGKLLSYNIALTKRELNASKEKDFETLKNIYHVKDVLSELIGIIEEELRER